MTRQNAIRVSVPLAAKTERGSDAQETKQDVQKSEVLTHHCPWRKLIETLDAARLPLLKARWFLCHIAQLGFGVFAKFSQLGLAYLGRRGTLYLCGHTERRELTAITPYLQTFNSIICTIDQFLVSSALSRSGACDLKPKGTLLFLKLSGNVCRWIWIGASIFSIYYLYGVLANNAPWPNLLWPIIIVLLFKWLSVFLHGIRHRLDYVDQLVKRGYSHENAEAAWQIAVDGGANLLLHLQQTDTCSNIKSAMSELGREN